MKKIFTLVVVMITVALAFSCATPDPARRYPNMVADADPVSAGTVTVEFDRFFSSTLNKVDVEAVFHPRLNSVALEFKYELITYRQYWDALSRQQFASALNMYKADYDAQKLVTSYNRSRAVYGKTKARTEWETFKFSKTHVAYPVIELGYRFRGKNPFLATLMRSAPEEVEMGSSGELVESQQIIMYFTRRHAEDLAELFDQAYLMGLLQIDEKPETEAPAPAANDAPYQEYDS